MTVSAIAPETIAADLRNAAEALHKYGWTRGQFWDRNTGRLCLVGAVTVGVHGRLPTVAGLLPGGKPIWGSSRVLSIDEQKRARAAEKALTHYIRHHDLIDISDPDEDLSRGFYAVDWNDEQCRNIDEAVQLLLATAAELCPEADGAVS